LFPHLYAITFLFFPEDLNLSIFAWIESLSNILKAELANQTYKRFLILSRKVDETNVILSFTKREGKTSYGFLIPENLSPDVLANIDTITREVKQKLLSDQSIISDINGGTFGP
jgi:cold shock CspA family protein